MSKIWRNISLGQIISLEYGKPLSDELRVEDGKFPVYGANGIKARTNTYMCEGKSLIIGRKGSAGEINFTEEKYWPLDVTYFVKYNPAEINLYYLYHLLKELDLPHLAKGVKPGINRNDVYRIRVNLPSIEEQEKIVQRVNSLFDSTNKAKEKLQLQLDKIAELEKAFLQKVLNEN